MKKATQQLLIIFLFFGSLVLFLIYIRLLIVKSNDDKLESFNDDVKKTDLKNENEDYNYVDFAQKILDHLESQKDDYGFYGGIRQCYNLKNNNCDWQLNNNISQLIATRNKNLISAYSSQRYSIPVIWARYRNYLRSFDDNQLKMVYKDLDNLINRVIENSDLDMQTHSFNCVLMEEIIKSPHIDEEYKKKAKKICNNNYFEIHPQSLVFYSQNKRVPLVFLKFDDLPEDIETNNFVRPDNSELLSDNQRIIFEKETLKKEVSELIKKIENKQKLNENKINSIAITGREKFITRENFAIVDRAAAARIDNYFDESDSANQIDYLILMKEVLSYYLMQNQNYSELDKCLLYENVNYYKVNYDNSLKIDQLKTDLNTELFSKNLLPCFVVKELLNNTTISQSNLYENIIQNNKKYKLGLFWPGYAYSTKEEFNYDDPFGNLYINVEINALLAGLLLK